MKKNITYFNIILQFFNRENLLSVEEKQEEK